MRAPADIRRDPLATEGLTLRPTAGGYALVDARARLVAKDAEGTVLTHWALVHGGYLPAWQDDPFPGEAP